MSNSINSSTDSNKMRVTFRAVSAAIFAMIFAAAGFSQSIDEGWYNASGTSFTIGTAAQLAGLAAITNKPMLEGGDDFEGKTITLTADIDLAAYTNWTPIGDDGARFSGIFDGNGKVIKNLKINRPEQANQGLFGLIYGGLAEGDNRIYGMVKNLGLVDVNVVGGNFTGGLAGSIQERGTGISNCYVTGTVSGASATGAVEKVGGIAGYFIRVNHGIKNCYFSGTVSVTTSTATGSANMIGGLAGSIYETAVTDCYVTGTVNTVGETGGSIGGLVGEATNNSVISNCYSTATVNANLERSSFWYGGLIGALENGTSVSNSAALNPEVVNGRGRVIGIDGNNTQMTNNFGFVAMKNKNGAADWSNIGANDYDGANVDAVAIITGIPFATFDAAVWNKTFGKLPTLKGVGQQDLDIPMYVINRLTLSVAAQPKLDYTHGDALNMSALVTKLTDPSGGTVNVPVTEFEKYRAIGMTVTFMGNELNFGCGTTAAPAPINADNNVCVPDENGMCTGYVITGTNEPCSPDDFDDGLCSLSGNNGNNTCIGISDPSAGITLVRTTHNGQRFTVRIPKTGSTVAAVTTNPLVIEKAVPDVTWPTWPALTAGAALKTITITGGSSVPAGGTFTWQYPDSVIISETEEQNIVFTPAAADADNYHYLIKAPNGQAVVSVLTRGRENPVNNGKDALPVTVTQFEFAAGPNPVNKSSGHINFFISSSKSVFGTFTIYDQTGKAIRKIKIRDKVSGTARRIIGSWDLRDVRGSLVSEGTYLVRGTIKTSDGKSEKVSAVVGIGK